MAVYIAVMLGLIPWTISLVYTLPAQHFAPHWNVTWVGFDLVLLTTLATTVFLSYRRSVWVILPAMALGVLLLVDAWLDITTAAPGNELTWALITGLAAEIPLAAASFWLAVKTILVYLKP
ncbi:MAG: hypothetical protein JWN01_533 [Patescibacteria group bacterium]|nr:hypothetical protein [Patescibacteria group bacterium]